MTTSLPADIAAAIEAFEGAVDATDYSVGPHDRKAARAALEAVILAHLGGGGWRPIESAPADGSKILVCAPEKHAAPWIAAHAQGKWKGTPWKEGNQFGRSSYFEPTHWQPLPSPPATGLSRAALAEQGSGE